MMTIARFPMKSTVLAVALAALSLTADAAGLGKLTVLSGLGQPLNAELELTATRDELSTMNARLAPNEAFKQAGIEFAPVLAGIKLNIAKRADGKSYLRLSSDRPINEPFIDLLVQLDWAQGRLIREYTFLLDPPEAVQARQQVAPVTLPESKAAPAAKPSVSRAEPKGAGAATREVSRGDTLGRIADETKPDGISVDQMLVALFRANKGAFIGNNMNRLRAGAILNIPDREAIAAVSPTDARRVVVAQAADFNAYRRRVAAAAAAAPAPEEGAPQQAAAGKIAPRVEEKAPGAAAEPRDQLRVSKSEAAKAAQANQARIASLEEDKVAKEKALKEASSRVSDLEKNVKELQKLLELKNQQLAELQKQAAAGVSPAAIEPKKPEAAAVPAEKPAPAGPAMEAKPTAAQPAAAPPVPAESKPAVTASEEQKPAAAVAEKPVEVAPKPAEVAQAPVSHPAPETQPAMQEKTVEAPKAAAEAKQPAPPPAEGGGFLAGLLDNPLALYGGGGALAGLLGLLGYRMLQRRKEDVPAPATEGKMAAQSVFGATGGQSVDTSASSIQTDFSHSGMTAIDADEGVDPVAEADVYMAYGRDAQAEEILLDALKNEPTRHAIHVKLMEIYAQRKSLKQFENHASELYAQTGGVGADWEKAAAMGRKLDPANPLYGGKPAAEPVAAATPAVASPVGAAAMAGVAAGGAAALAAGAMGATDAVAAAGTAGAGEASDRLKDTWAMPGGLSGVGASAEAGAAAVTAASEQPTTVLKPAAPADIDFNLELPSLEAEPAEQVQSAAAEALDFDLGLDIAEPATGSRASGPESTVLLEPGVAKKAVAAEMSFEPGQTAATQAADKAEAFSGTESLVSRNVIDFDLGDAAEPEVAAKAPAPKPDVPVMDLERTDVAGTLIDFNLDELTASRPSNDIAVMDLERTDVGGNLLDFNFELEDGRLPGDKESVPTLDLSGINLDLPVPQQAAPAPADEAAAAMVPEFEADVSADDIPEVATKLELAKAYEEMGDREGARELLQEVVSEGTAGQQQKARDMIARLS